MTASDYIGYTRSKNPPSFCVCAPKKKKHVRRRPILVLVCVLESVGSPCPDWRFSNFPNLGIVYDTCTGQTSIMSDNASKDGKSSKESTFPGQFPNSLPSL